MRVSSLTLAVGYLESCAWVLRRRVRRHEHSWRNVAYQWMSCESSGTCRERHRCLFEHVSICISILVYVLQADLVTDAPARLKKELDSVINLQRHVDTVTSSIETTKTTLAKGNAPPDCMALLSSLESIHSQLATRIEKLYASLNIEDNFPELQKFDLTFVRVLLLARDLKILIRKKALGSFFEWSRIDQAVGGKDQALGKYFQCSINVYIITYFSPQVPSFINRRGMQSLAGNLRFWLQYVNSTSIASN